jgi:hypothetical protein
MVGQFRGAIVTLENRGLCYDQRTIFGQKQQTSCPATDDHCICKSQADLQEERRGNVGGAIFTLEELGFVLRSKRGDDFSKSTES